LAKPEYHVGERPSDRQENERKRGGPEEGMGLRHGGVEQEDAGRQEMCGERDEKCRAQDGGLAQTLDRADRNEGDPGQPEQQNRNQE
jgi:hypothetical protein